MNRDVRAGSIVPTESSCSQTGGRERELGRGEVETSRQLCERVHQGLCDALGELRLALAQPTQSPGEAVTLDLNRAL